MNVFVLDLDMEKSAQMLDDAHLKAQINEACQILMANWNHDQYPNAKIGHLTHPVTKFYSEPITDDQDDTSVRAELVCYLMDLLDEYEYRFEKKHQNWFWLCGFTNIYSPHPFICFHNAKTYINGSMTDNIDEIRNHIMTKPMQKNSTWTNREKPEWWVV